MHFLVPAVFSGEFSTTDTESLADGHGHGHGHGPEGDPATDGHGPEAEPCGIPVMVRRPERGMVRSGSGGRPNWSWIGPSRSWVNWVSLRDSSEEDWFS